MKVYFHLYHLCLSDMANTFTNLRFRCPIQNRWFLGFRDIVSEAFREARINSEQFFFKTQHILEREENWISWKNEGCPSFIKDR